MVTGREQVFLPLAILLQAQHLHRLLLYNLLEQMVVSLRICRVTLRRSHWLQQSMAALIERHSHGHLGSTTLDALGQILRILHRLPRSERQIACPLSPIACELVDFFSPSFHS